MRVKITGGKTLAKVSVVLAVTVVALVLLLAGSALAAPPWPDAPNAWWISTYGITESQAATVAEGGQDGLFRPAANVTRAQFAKMAVAGLGVATAAPAMATFPDVPPSHFFYPWIEGGAAAGLIAGQIDGSFGPDKSIIRQQANSILGNYLAQKELSLRGHIAGKNANYPSLNTWYLTEGVALLAQFSDASRVASVHAPATAYLVFRGVVEGSNVGGTLYLAPGLNLTRGQAVALVLRVKAVTFSTALPTITALNPSSGLPAGGNSVVITGTNFTDVFAVKFGTANATFVVNSATQITATAPAGTVGTTVDVTIETAAGKSVPNAASKYTYGPPSVTALNPAAGPGAGGNTVIITGTNLSGATAVKFGVKNATNFTVNSNTQITAVAPSGSGTVDVTVTTPAGTTATSLASKYSYGAPMVSGLTPTSGPAVGGNNVTITGTGFTGVSAVKFGTKNALSFVINSPTSITAVAPANVVGAIVDITVTTPAGTSPTGLGSKYHYTGPVITALTPNAGPAAGGNTVIITGTGFTNVSAVKFGTKPAVTFTVNSPTQITAIAPSGTAGSVVDVTVTTVAGTNELSDVTKYTYGLAVTAVAPNHGLALGGNTVIIHGVGFKNATSVNFGAETILPANFTVNTQGTEIMLVAPAGTGKVDIRVNVGALKSANTDADDYVYDPQITQLDPNAGALSGGNVVRVLGKGFTGATAVKFGGVSGSDFQVVSDTEIRVKAPSRPNPVTLQVQVIGKYGLSNTLPYMYVGAPSITSLNVTSGPTYGGTFSLTINGTNFTGATSVTLGGNPLTGFVVESPTKIVASSIPAHAAGPVDVVVTTPAGSGTGTGLFTYEEPVVTDVDNPQIRLQGGGWIAFDDDTYSVDSLEVDLRVRVLDQWNNPLAAGASATGVKYLWRGSSNGGSDPDTLVDADGYVYWNGEGSLGEWTLYLGFDENANSEPDSGETWFAAEITWE